MKESDIRITPDWLVALLRDFAGDRSVCDVCTQPDNPLGAERFFTFETDGLNAAWAETVAHAWRFTYWNNCPYSAGQVLLWSQKSIREARTFGLEVLLLTQADVSTGWYREIRDNADARCHLGRRVSFLEPDGEGGYRPCVGGAKFGSQVAYFGPRRRRFTRIFGAHGEVLHGLGPQEDE